MTTAYVSEIFPTIQGEGPYTGEKQLFLRFAGCPLRCNYCDTPGSLTTQGHKQMTVEQVFTQVSTACRHQSIGTVSVTGGEPLVNAAFLKEVLPLLKKNNLRVYLETAGVHAKALLKIIDWCDVVAMDVKLPSATGKEFWNEHREFLKAGGNKIFVKIVLERLSLLSEIKRAIEMIKEQNPPPLLILQPATPQGDSIFPPSPESVEEIRQFALKQLPRVLVMPQQHKVWGMK